MNGRCKNKNPIEDAIAELIYKGRSNESLCPFSGVIVYKTDSAYENEQTVAVVIKRPVESKKEVSEWLESTKDLGIYNILPGCGPEKVFITANYINFPFPVKPPVMFNPDPHVLIEQLKKSLELED
jgi:hypothetical protein